MKRPASLGRRAGFHFGFVPAFVSDGLALWRAASDLHARMRPIAETPAFSPLHLASSCSVERPVRCPHTPIAIAAAIAKVATANATERIGTSLSKVQLPLP